MRNFRGRYRIALLLGLVMLWQQPFQTAQAAVQRVKITSGSRYLIAEALNNDLIHFES